MATIETVHIDAPLTNFAVKLGVGGGLVADEIFPIVPVNKVSDKFFVFSRDEEMSDNIETKVSDRDLANEADWIVTESDYSAVQRRLRHFIGQTIIDNADSPIKPFQEATTMLVGRLRTGVEKRVQALIEDTGTIGNAVPSVKWDAAASVVIEKDVDTAKEIFAVACGHEPNIILIPPAVSKVVKRDSEVRELIKYTQNDLLINGDLPPSLWNMRVMIPGALNNTANLGQNASISRIWTNDKVELLWVDPSPGIQTAGAGYQFSPQAQQPRFAVQRYTEPGRRGQWVEVTLLNDEKLVSAACVFIIDDVLG